MTLKKVTKATIKALIKKEGKANFIICPSKCFPNFGHPFNMACEVTACSVEELEKKINSFVYYNCNNELGNRVHFYIKTA